MNPDDEILFVVTTPLGFTVRVTQRYWTLITTVRHPVMAGHEADVQATLSEPEEIRRSRSDENVLLFYPTQRTGRWVCAVARRQDDTGFLITRLPDRRDQGRNPRMADLNIFHDPTGHTLTVWFGAPQSQYVCEETGDEVILMKDKSGAVIGFEKLNFQVPGQKHLQVAFETIAG